MTKAAVVNARLAARRANRALHLSRDAWIARAVEQVRAPLRTLGRPLPPVVRFGVGPLLHSARSHVAGCCHPPEVSSEGAVELTLSLWHDPAPQAVLGTIAHELIHAAGIKNHYADFARTARGLGLRPVEGDKGKWASAGFESVETASLPQWARAALDVLGAWPVERLSPVMKTRKQATRMIKVTCSQCDVVWRTVRRHLPPVCCPACGGPAECPVVHWPEAEDDESTERS